MVEKKDRKVFPSGTEESDSLHLILLFLVGPFSFFLQTFSSVSRSKVIKIVCSQASIYSLKVIMMLMAASSKIFFPYFFQGNIEDVGCGFICSVLTVPV